MALGDTRTLPRSFLYVPGDRPDLFGKAERSAADAVILDLEDAVAATAKAAARDHVGRWLADAPSPDRWWVRVDPSATKDDIAAVGRRPGPAGVILAKAELATLRELAELAPSLPVIGLIESARGLNEAAAMGEIGNLVTFGVGRADLLADLRIDPAAAPAGALAALHLRIVVECAAARLAAPVAPTSTDVRDLEGFERTTRELAALGFRSRTCLHPRQCEVANRALTPTREELASARDVITRLEAGGATAVDEHGRFIDAAVARAARETVARVGGPTDKETEHASPR